MRIAFPIDGLLCDTASLKKEWLRQLGEEKQLDASFWAALKPYEDSIELISNAVQNNWDFYVFAERPKSLFLPTRAWLRNNFGLNLSKDTLIMPALKRYDCRLLGVDVFIDSDLKTIENLAIETVHPIHGYYVDRTEEGALQKVIDRINASICNRD